MDGFKVNCQGFHNLLVGILCRRSQTGMPTKLGTAEFCLDNDENCLDNDEFGGKTRISVF